MRHARSDYDHIQDLTQLGDVGAAYLGAMTLQTQLPMMQAARSSGVEPDLRYISRTLSALLQALHPYMFDRFGDRQPMAAIPVDEPVFLLRAKDQIAPSVVRAYAKMHHGDERFVRACTAQADRMEDYAREHYQGGKEADAPAEALRI
jgi:hypothetical protein